MRDLDVTKDQTSDDDTVLFGTFARERYDSHPPKGAPLAQGQLRHSVRRRFFFAIGDTPSLSVFGA